MRRLIAYLSLVISIILGVGFNAAAPMRDVKANLEYSSGREFVYKISNKTEDGVESEEELPDTAIDEIYDVMDSRFKTYGVSEYQLAKEGKDVIRATATMQSETQYNRLQTYLNYSSDFTLRVAKTDETEAIATAAQVFDNVKARIEYRGPYPFIIIPISDPTYFTDTIISVAQKIQEEKEVATEDGSSPQLVEDAKIVMWSNYNPDTDIYSEASNNNDIRAKIFLHFDYRSIWWNKEKTEIAVASPLRQGEDAEAGKTDYKTEEISAASETARFMVNVFNAGVLNYDVDFLFSNTSYGPSVEGIISLGSKDRVALSRTLIASAIALVVVFVALFLIYRLSAFSIVSSLLATLVATLFLFNAITIEVSTSAIIGFIFVAVMAIMGSVSYLTKFKNEIYRGRTMKKAHTEAIKRSTYINLDTIVISLIVGVIAYFAGNAATLGFATVLIFSSIVSVITILFHNSITFWLLANNTSTQKAYHLFGINAKKVPNIIEDEKPTYFGRFADTKPLLFAKPLGIVFSSLAVIAMIAIGITSGIGVSPLNIAVQDSNITRVYLRVSENSEIDIESKTNSPQIILESFSVDGQPLKLKKENDSPIYEKHTYVKTEGEGENKISTNFTYYVYVLDGEFSNDTIVTYTSGDGSVITDNFYDVLFGVISAIDTNKVDVSINHVNKTASNPSVSSIAILGLFISLATAIYFLFRRGLANAIAHFAISLGIGALTIGFFMATRLSVHPLVSLGGLIAILIISLINNLIFGSIKQVKEDNMLRNLALEEKEERGLTMALTPVYVVFASLAVAFLIFVAIVPTTVTMVYLSSLIATILALTLVVSTQLPFVRLLNKLFGKIKIKPRNNAKSKARAEKAKKTSGPEEAIFIGIND